MGYEDVLISVKSAVLCRRDTAAAAAAWNARDHSIRGTSPTSCYDNSSHFGRCRKQTNQQTNKSLSGWLDIEQPQFCGMDVVVVSSIRNNCLFFF